LKNSSFSSGIGEFADLGDFERKFGLHLRQFVLFELQGRGTLRGILVELVDVDLHLGADLLALEGLAFLVVHRDQPHVGILDAQFAVVERDGQRLVVGDLLDVHQPAVTTQEIRAVVVVHLLVDLDAVVGHLVLGRKSEVDLGRLADLEYILELGVVIEIESTLLLGGNHVAQIVDVLLLEVLEDGVRRRAVRLLGHYALAVHLFDDSHRHHAGAEARDVGLAAVVAQRFLDGFAVVLFADLDRNQRGLLLFLCSFDLHNVYLFACFHSLWRAKIRKSEGKCKRCLQFAEREYPRSSRKYEKVWQAENLWLHAVHDRSGRSRCCRHSSAIFAVRSRRPPACHVRTPANNHGCAQRTANSALPKIGKRNGRRMRRRKKRGHELVRVAL